LKRRWGEALDTHGAADHDNVQKLPKKKSLRHLFPFLFSFLISIEFEPVEYDSLT
jgi:hypothetical protein